MALESNKTQEVVDSIKTEEEEEVELAIDKINNQGDITMMFNQKLVVPSFMNKKNAKRNLATVDKQEIFRKVLIMNLKSVESGMYQRLDFSLNDWTDSKITMHVNFTNPFDISAGDDKDQL